MSVDSLTIAAYDNVVLPSQGLSYDQVAGPYRAPTPDTILPPTVSPSNYPSWFTNGPSTGDISLTVIFSLLALILIIIGIIYGYKYMRSKKDKKITPTYEPINYDLVREWADEDKSKNFGTDEYGQKLI